MPRTKEKNKQFEQLIHDKEGSFKSYLMEHYEGTKVEEQLNRWAQNAEVLIFSGVIRDFFLERENSFRDLDVVLSEIDESTFVEGVLIKRNQFGGVKMLIGDKKVDVWRLKDTWGLKQMGMFPFPISLLDTSFYNFSAIVYNYNEECFYFDKDFVEFLAYRKLDIVFEENPLPELCIVNSLWYSQSLELELSTRLKKWMVSHYMENYDYEPVQRKHFGYQKYTNREIRNEINKLRSCIK